MADPETYFEMSSREAAASAPFIIQVEGLEELQEALERFPKQWREIATAALTPGMALIASDAKTRAPVDEGILMSSIGSATHPAGTWEIKKLGSQIVGKLGSRLEYASYQEYGTRFQSGKPYMRPALAAKAAEAIEVFKRKISEALRRLGL